MKKYIYGLIDTRTKSLGDLCLLDRDEEFRYGLINLLSDPNIPGYIVNDLCGFCFGSVSLSDDADDPFPVFDIYAVPKVIISGASPEIQAKYKERLEASDHADVPENC